jgi:hypothetical protein
MTDEACTGCGHSLSRHFRDVKGIARCLVTESGTSTSGVIGLPWELDCDCADFQSEQGDRRRAGEAAERARHDAFVARIVGGL